MKRRKLIFDFIALILSVLLLITTSYGWLSRSFGGGGNVIAASGFSYSGDYLLLHEIVSVKTQYKNQDDTWVEIGNNFSDIVTGTETYDEDTIKLFIGNRSEFETKVTNLTNNDVDCSAYFVDIDVAADIMDHVIVGVYDPVVKMYDTDDFVPDDIVDPTLYNASLLDMSDSFILAAHSSMTIKWYIALDSQYKNYSYLALLDQDDNQIIEIINGTNYHYCVVDYDGFNGTIYHAYRVNEDGEFVDSTGAVTYDESAYVEYNNSYTNLKYESVASRSVGYAVKIRGLYVKAGKSI